MVYFILKYVIFDGEDGDGDYRVSSVYKLVAVYEDVENANKHLASLQSGDTHNYQGVERWEYIVRELRIGQTMFDASEYPPPSWVTHPKS